MTKPKRRIGNPLGESGLSTEEKHFWQEAHYYAAALEQASTAMKLYTEGKGTGALAYSIVTLAMRLFQAQESALALRRGRIQ